MTRPHVTLTRSRVWALLGLLTLAAAALRLPFLSTQSLWLDEVYTRFVVDQHSLVGIWNQIAKTESTPPLSYVLAKFSTDICGNAGPFALRLPAALALIAAVPASYLAFRRLIGIPAALAAAAFVAVDPTLVSYSTDARSYGLLVLTGLLSIWAFAAILDDPTPARYMWWVLAAAASVWTHYFAVFTLIGEVVILLVARPVVRRRTLIAVLALAVLAGALIPLALTQANSGNSAFITAIPWPRRLADTVRQFAAGTNVPYRWLEGIGLLGVYATLLCGLWLGRASRGTWILGVLMLTTVGLPLLSAILGVEDRFYMRNMMIAIPLLGALAAPALVRYRALPLAGVAVVACVIGVWVAADWRYGQVDWRDAIAAATPAQRAGPVIVVAPGAFPGPVAGVYLGRTRATSAVATTHLLEIVAPSRPAHDRGLVPVRAPTSVTRALSGFTVTATRLNHGFALRELRAGSAVSLTPGHVGDAVLFAPR